MAKKPVLISMVAAMGRNREIGRNNELPWNVPSEMALFKRATIGKTILMGRNTAQSLPCRLPRRTNLVLTRTSAPHKGQVSVRSIEEALAFADGELVIIGGEQLYKAALPLAGKLYLSYLDLAVEGADKFFPVLARQDWFATAYEEYPVNTTEVSPAFIYVEWHRIALREQFNDPQFLTNEIHP